MHLFAYVRINRGKLRVFNSLELTNGHRRRSVFSVPTGQKRGNNYEQLLARPLRRGHSGTASARSEGRRYQQRRRNPAWLVRRHPCSGLVNKRADRRGGCLRLVRSAPQPIVVVPQGEAQSCPCLMSHAHPTAARTASPLALVRPSPFTRRTAPYRARWSAPTPPQTSNQLQRPRQRGHCLGNYHKIGHETGGAMCFSTVLSCSCGFTMTLDCTAPRVQYCPRCGCFLRQGWRDGLLVTNDNWRF
jgi:hypothetical protein